MHRNQSLLCQIYAWPRQNGHEITVCFMQYAYCSCVISRMSELSRATDPQTTRLASCMIHNASCKWLCSGNERSLFHMVWNFSYLQMLHVLACTGKCTHPLARVVLKFPYSSMDCKQTCHRLYTICFAIHYSCQRVHYPTYQTVVCYYSASKRAIYQ